MRTPQRNNPGDTQVSAERGARAAPDTGAEIPPQPVVKTVVRQPCPCNTGKAQNLYPPAAPGEPRLEQGDASKEAVILWKTHGESSSHWSYLPLKDCTLWKCDPHCSSWGKTTASGVDSCWQSSCRTGLLWEGPHGEQGNIPHP